MSLTKASFSMLSGATGNVLDYGANITDTSVDSTAAFQAAIDAHDTVRVPQGTYAIDGTITPSAGKTFLFDSGVVLKRFAANTANTDPLIHLNNDFCSLVGLGGGYDKVIITTQNKCPQGVVKLGQHDMLSSPKNVQKCRIDSLTLKGSIAGGQTSGDPDIALLAVCPQIDELGFSYFHYINNIETSYANIGMELRGWINGCQITNIYGVYCGNSSVANGCWIYLHGGLENNISNGFFNSSTDSTGVIIERYDNRAVTGGKLHIPQYNNITGLTFEQGGTGAHSIVVRGDTTNCDSLNSMYQFVDVTNLGFTAPSNWIGTFQNSVHTLATYQAQTVAATTLQSSYLTVSQPVEFSKVTAPIVCNGTTAYSSKAASSNKISWDVYLTTAGAWQPGFFVIHVADIATDATNAGGAWWMYSFAAYGQTNFGSVTLQDSGGTTGNYTVTITSSGVDATHQIVTVEISSVAAGGTGSLQTTWVRVPDSIV